MSEVAKQMAKDMTAYIKRLALFGMVIVLVTMITLVAPGTAPQPAAAQNNAIWIAEYYDNLYLLGDPVFETQIAGMELYWGETSPNAAVPADSFSARFGADPYFTAGTYRFYVQVDDEVKIKVGQVAWEPPQLDTFGAPRVGELITFDVALTEGTHHIQVDYREQTGDAYLYLDWVNLGSGAAAPAFPIPVHVNLPNPWTVQYFNNPSLQGAPVVAQSETESLTRNWGEAAPETGVQADNFSIRFVSFQPLQAGTYDVVVQADDGVRVIINGQVLVNEWHGATAETYTASYNHAGGDASITVEYYDSTGVAHLSVQLGVPAAATPGGAPAAPTGATATVLAWRLNVRDAPSVLTGNVIAKIDQGQKYPVVGANDDQSWVRIDVNGTLGWVSARWVRVTVPQGAPTPTPVPLQPPAATGYYLTARENLNIRNLPSFGAATVGLLPFQQQAGIIGRTANNAWWQIRYGAVTGWVSNYYVDLQPGINFTLIPVTG